MTAKIVRRSFLGSIGAGTIGVMATGTTTTAMPDRPAAAGDVTAEFARELLALLDRYKGRPGFGVDMRFCPERIPIEPKFNRETGLAWARTRRGPKTWVYLTLTDGSRAPT